MTDPHPPPPWPLIEPTRAEPGELVLGVDRQFHHERCQCGDCLYDRDGVPRTPGDQRVHDLMDSLAVAVAEAQAARSADRPSPDPADRPASPGTAGRAAGPPPHTTRD